jgi:ABC-type lipoprotein release transport system permease subunit
MYGLCYVLAIHLPVKLIYYVTSKFYNGFLYIHAQVRFRGYAFLHKNIHPFQVKKANAFYAEFIKTVDLEVLNKQLAAQNWQYMKQSLKTKKTKTKNKSL